MGKTPPAKAGEKEMQKTGVQSLGQERSFGV